MAAGESAGRRSVISLSGVRKTFDVKGGELTALDGVTLTVEDGEFVSIIGPSGCGKSTILKLVADIYKPTAGEIVVNERSATEARLNRELGVVFQDPTLFPWRDVLGNVLLPAQDRRPPERFHEEEGPRHARVGRAGRVHQEPTRSAVGGACGSGSPSRGRSCSNRGSCCSTSRSGPWMRSRAGA